MPSRPFLSHKHEQAHDLELLRDELLLRGAGGWQDAHDLRLGQRWSAAFRRAIGNETGGFIWWGTASSLKSRTITRIEVPAALRRAGRRRGTPYPFVPLFVDLRPGTNGEDIRRAFGRRWGKRLLDRQGLTRERHETLSDFARRAARRYVHDLVVEHPRQELRIAISGGRALNERHDLSLDWRRLLDAEGRAADGSAISTLVETLADIRAAAQTTADCPHLIVEPHLRLPLAALVGWEFNRVRPIKLTLVQTSPAGPMTVDDLPGNRNRWPSPEPQCFDRAGPAVLAVSVGKNLGEAVNRYAAAQGACEARHLHVDVDDFDNGRLSTQDICDLAEWVVARLADLNMRAVPKHLLLLGPVSLAARIGAAAGGTGTTFVPFWDGDTGYTSGVLIG